MCYVYIRESKTLKKIFAERDYLYKREKTYKREEHNKKIRGRGLTIYKRITLKKIT